MTKTNYITERTVNEVLGQIENDLIKILNWHKEEKIQTENFLEHEVSEHLKYINAYEDGSIAALKDSINAIRKRYNRFV